MFSSPTQWGISIAPQKVSSDIFSSQETDRINTNLLEIKEKKTCWAGRQMEQVQILPTKEAKQRSQCQAHGGVCARAEIFRGLKTVVALRLCIHHRGDCCVCPKERTVGVWADCKVSWLGGWLGERNLVDYTHWQTHIDKHTPVQLSNMVDITGGQEGSQTCQNSLILIDISVR